MVVTDTDGSVYLGDTETIEFASDGTLLSTGDINFMDGAADPNANSAAATFAAGDPANVLVPITTPLATPSGSAAGLWTPSTGAATFTAFPVNLAGTSVAR